MYNTKYIKNEFRAWDRIKERMVKNFCEGYFLFIDFNGCIMPFAYEGDGIYAGLDLSVCDAEKYDSRFELMQFIGWRDKNNKKIFDGDIVKWTPVYYTDCSAEEIEGYGDTVIAEIFYSDGMWLAMWIIEENRGVLMNPSMKNDIFEVVGNKFENPEYFSC